MTAFFCTAGPGAGTDAAIESAGAALMALSTAIVAINARFLNVKTTESDGANAN